MSAPKRNPRTVLATGGLLLVPLAALWLLVSPRLSQPGTPPALPRGGFEESGGPAPRVVSGGPLQGEWALLGVTALGPEMGEVPMPPPIAPPAGAADLVRIASGWKSGAGTGLWIGLQGGFGFPKLTIPQDGRRHVYPFGHVSLVAQPSPDTTGMVFRWETPGQVGALSAVPPYQLVFAGVTSSPEGLPTAQTVMLVPPSFSRWFRVTARPLSAEGRPTGGAVTLVCQPVTAAVLFVQIPACYSAATRQFRVTVARAGGSAEKTGSWQLTRLPASVPNGPDGLPLAAAAQAGPFAFHAVAAEVEDTRRITGTGVPTIRYLLSARRLSPVPPRQSWALQVDRVTPQWTVPRSRPLPGESSSPAGPLGFLSLTGAVSSANAPDRVVQDEEIGTAYPGQQHWVKIEGAALRAEEHTETVTFHDADVVHDAGFGGDRIVWHRPETQTTASGIAVTVLNGRPGKLEAVTMGRQDWWYDGGNAELLLAWHLPPDVKTTEYAPLAEARLVGMPHAVGPLQTIRDILRSDPYPGAVALPGATEARSLTQSGYSLLRLSVSPAGGPLPGTGPPVAPLPRHLAAVTLQITFRERLEQRPLELVVPVRAALPPGIARFDPRRNPRLVPQPPPAAGPRAQNMRPPESRPHAGARAL